MHEVKAGSTQGRNKLIHDRAVKVNTVNTICSASHTIPRKRNQKIVTMDSFSTVNLHDT